MDTGKLRAFWLQNRDAIKSLRYEYMDKNIYTERYVFNYKEDLESIYNILDELVNTETIDHVQDVQEVSDGNE